MNSMHLIEKCPTVFIYMSLTNQFSQMSFVLQRNVESKYAI